MGFVVGFGCWVEDGLLEGASVSGAAGGAVVFGGIVGRAVALGGVEGLHLVVVADGEEPLLLEVELFGEAAAAVEPADDVLHEALACDAPAGVVDLARWWG